MKTEIKLCKDCKHVKRGITDIIFFLGYEFAKCSASMTISPVHVVSGKGGNPKFAYCDFEREPTQSNCGPSGKNFEAKR